MKIKTYGNALISKWQSSLSKVLSDDQGAQANLAAEHPAMVATCTACEELEKAIEDGTPEQAFAEPISKGDLFGECARLYVSLLAAKMSNNKARIEELENQIRYSVCDPLWAKTLLEFRKGEDNELPYRHYESLNDFVLPLPEKENIKIAFVSDWGTGTKLAQNVMRCIADQNPDVVIHLGDIYYSGARKEVEENFLNIVREHLPETTQIFTLAGNHDLYAGGEGYYWLIDQLGQPASYFSLQNDDWQILGIGAPPEAENPGAVLGAIPAIETREVDWHLDKLNNSESRKTIMLSHYQLFTASGNIGRDDNDQPLALNPALYGAFKEQLKNIDLWMWGHEHNFIVFEPYLGMRRGRCIGSGALPVSVIWQPYKQLPNLVLPEGVEHAPKMNLDAKLGNDGDYYHHGFCVLNINGRLGQMDYYQVAGVNGDGEIIFTEEI